MLEENICENAEDHGCSPCDKCSEVFHRFTNEPHCDGCGKPLEDYFGKLKEMVS